MLRVFGKDASPQVSDFSAEEKSGLFIHCCWLGRQSSQSGQAVHGFLYILFLCNLYHSSIGHFSALNSFAKTKTSNLMTPKTLVI